MSITTPAIGLPAGFSRSAPISTAARRIRRAAPRECGQARRSGTEELFGISGTSRIENFGYHRAYEFD